MSDLLSLFDTQIQNQEQLLREREQEIEQLRRQRDRLAELTRRREELHAQLREVEDAIAEIERAIAGTLDKFGTRFEAASPLPPPQVHASAARVNGPPPDADAKPTTLKDEIRKVLRAARGPLTGPGIATRVKAGGYKTTSANFANIVKKTLHEMRDVANVRGEGYRLKK